MEHKPKSIHIFDRELKRPHGQIRSCPPLYCQHKKKRLNFLIGLQHHTRGKNGQNMNGIVQLPFPCSCRPNLMPLDNLQTHWFYTSYIPLQILMCIHRIAKKGSQKNSPRRAGILGMFEGGEKGKMRATLKVRSTPVFKTSDSPHTGSVTLQEEQLQCQSHRWPAWQPRRKRPLRQASL